MNAFGNINALLVQRRRCCTSDSPGLTSESEGYPGSFAVSGNNAVGVVPFIPQLFVVTFHAENVQHLRR
ncbi:lipopolysaccharide modification acyltransferase [Segatella salivae]